MNKRYSFLVFFFILLLGFSSCQKETSIDNSLSAEDHGNIMLTTDGTIGDATAAAGQVRGLSGKTEGGLQLLCGAASIDTGNGHKIVITYDNVTPCKGMVRGGSITVSIISGPFWKDAYAQLQVVFTNLTLTNSVTGAAYTINGNYIVTNETGGLAWRILAGLDQNTSVRHRVQATGLSVTFPNGSQRTWNIDRTVEYSSVVSNGNNLISLSVSSENKGAEESWGVDRNGNSFQSTFINAVSSNNNANCAWRPYQGEYSQIIGGKSVDILYGVDNNGNPLDNPNGCAYGFKITYTSAKKVLTKLVAYPF